MNTTKQQRLQVANTILQQLGGQRFTMMTGAKQYVAIEHGLMFSLPGWLSLALTKFALCSTLQILTQ